MSRDAVQHEPIGGLAAESVLHVVRVRWVEHDVDDPDVWVAHEAGAVKDCGSGPPQTRRSAKGD